MARITLLYCSREVFFFTYVTLMELNVNIDING